MSKQLKLTATFGIFFVLSTLISNKIFAQTTANGIFFQAVARDNFSNPAKDRKIYIESSIIQYTATGTKVLIEQHDATTDETGVFNISLGNGKRIGGSASNLTNIDWAMGPYYLSLKIAITPRAPIPNWDYTKEWIDLGTTPFGTVPYALYAGSAAGLNDKLSISDTSSMLAIYVKAQAIKTIENTVNTKIGITDTAAMLAPYKKMVNEIIASNITSLTAGSINSALNSKVNLADSAIVYITPMQLKSVKFDTTSIVQRIDTKLDKVTGIAGSATKLATARNINGVAFDGSGDITITSTADAGTLTGTTLKSTVTSSSLTSVGTLTNLTVTNPIAGSITGNAGTATNLTGLTTSVATLNNLSGVNSGDQTTITGNAGTATKLATARNINGVAFDGSVDITIPTGAAAETLTGTTLKSTVTGSSLTSVGTLTNLTVTNPIAGSVTGNAGTATNLTGLTTSVATLNNLSGVNSGDQTTITGNAATATKLATARNINGVAFDGSGDITITSTADAGTLTGTTLKSTVTGSSLTSVGTLTNLTVTNPIAGSVTGNAGTATKLAASKTINGVAFDGTADITAPAAAETLTGSTLKSTVTGSSLTSVGTLTNLTVTNPIAGSVTGNAATATNLTGLTTSVATLNNLSGVNSGDQTTITGNAGTATKLASARNINGVAFDGSADITIPTGAAAETLTGTTLKSTVTGSSLTSVGTLANLTVTNPIAGSVTGNAATATNLTGLTTSVATLNNLSGVNSGDQTTITGNAGTATKLAASKTINGVAFDGTEDITAPAAAETLTGSTLKSTVTGSSLTSVGTITSGVWSGTAVAIQKGGTGLTTVGTNGQVLTSNGTSITWATPASSSSSSPTYTTGLNSDLGGYVFFLSTDSKHGLVAETQDQSTPTTWYYAEDKISDQANHSTNGKKFTDWRLPTKHELNLMYSVKTSIGGFASNLYWSSTTWNDGTDAWGQNFGGGIQGNFNKGNTYYVRAVRAF